MEMLVIIGVPGWDLFMITMMDCSCRHQVYIEPHWLCNGSPAKDHIYCLCVCLCCVFWAIFIAVILGIFPLRLGHTRGILCVPFVWPSDDKHHAMYAQFKCADYISAKDNS